MTRMIRGQRWVDDNRPTLPTDEVRAADVPVIVLAVVGLTLAVVGLVMVLIPDPVRWLVQVLG